VQFKLIRSIKKKGESIDARNTKKIKQCLNFISLVLQAEEEKASSVILEFLKDSAEKKFIHNSVI
jgi:hypothetical protein